MMAKQYGFYFNSNACSGCKTCQIACKDKNDLDVGIRWRRIYEISGGNWIKDGIAWFPNVYAYHLSISCNHCEDPICVHSCPTTALQKRKDGIVDIDQDKCIGCHYCEWGCPYGAPQYDKGKGVMSKCDFCYDYLDEGKNPACVDACLMRVIEYGELEELIKKYGCSSEVFPLPEYETTKPSLVIKPHKNSVGINNENATVANKEEV